MADWYYARNNQRLGPVSDDQLRQLAAAGQLSPNDLLWRDGMPQWAAAGSIPGLFAAPPQAAAPPPGVAGAPPGYGAAPGYGGPQYRAGGGFGEFIQNTLQRVFLGNIDAPVSDSEKAQLTANGVTGETAQRYLAWRRCALWVSVVPLGIMVILNIISSILYPMKVFSGLGIVIEVVNILCWVALTGTAVWAALIWAKPRMSQFVVTLGFLVGFGIPLMISLLPSAWWLTESQPSTESPSEMERVQTAAGWTVTGYYAFFLALPLFFAVAAGILRASARVKTLLPESSFPGMALVAVGPLVALVYLGLPFMLNQAFMLFQYEYHILVLLALILFTVAPLIYTLMAGTFIRPIATPADRSAVSLWSWVSFGITAAGALCLIIFLIMSIPSDEKSAPSKPSSGSSSGPPKVKPSIPILLWTRLGTEFLGRSLFATVWASQFLLWASVLASRSGQPLAQNAEQRMAELEPVVGKI